MVDFQHDSLNTTVDSVQIIDLENAAYLPKGRCIKGMLAGNDNWRSPEAHFKGELNKPTDIFSFAAVVSTWTESVWAVFSENAFSVSTLYSDVLSLVLMKTSTNTRLRVHCLQSFAYNAKFRISEIPKDSEGY